jgi:hypothetical protein
MTEKLKEVAHTDEHKSKGFGAPNEKQARKKWAVAREAAGTSRRKAWIESRRVTISHCSECGIYF